MKKLYIVLLSAVFALGASAAPVGKHIKPAHPTAEKILAKYHSQTGKRAKGAMTKELAPVTTSRVAEGWTSLGMGTFCNDIATAGFFECCEQPQTYQVEVWQNNANPALYRIVDPWKNFPQYNQVLAEGGYLGLGESYYIDLDTTDPEHVKIPLSPLGMADVDGMAQICTWDEVVDMFDDMTYDEALEYAGTFSNGIISFAAEDGLCLVQGYYCYTGNWNCATSLALPGTELPVNYEITMYAQEAFCPDANNEYHYTIEGDSRIPRIYYGIIDDLTADYEDIVDEVISQGKYIKPGQTATFNMATAPYKSFAVFVPTDENATDREEAAANVLYNPAVSAGSWKVLGKAQMTEGFMSSLLDYPVETYDVVIEQSATDPGMLRICNPYQDWSQIAEYAHGHSHRHYIYLNAADYNNVYVTAGPVGLVHELWGEFALSSEYTEMLDWYGKEFLDAFGITSDGAIVDGVLTFGPNAYLMMFPSAYGDWVYVNCFDNPDYDENDYTTDEFLPGDFKLDMTEIFAGLSPVLAPESDGAVYYNLQGMRVATPSDAGVYIRRTAMGASKVMVK